MLKFKKAVILFAFIISTFKCEAQLDKQSDMNLTSNIYSVRSGNNTISIDAETGGRIISFKTGEYEFLVQKGIHSENFGSTFWSSPQSYWNWPPPFVLDSAAYSVNNVDGTIKLISGDDPVTGFRFVKEISAGKKNCTNISYSIINISNEVKSAAPWEISRVHKGGLLFFPMGEKPLGKKYFDPAEVTVINGIAWYKDEIKRPDNHQLTTADGTEGWMAYAIDNKLFIKRYADTKPELLAPDEGEIIFYISSVADYIEIELQGKYEEIKPTEKTRWEIEWLGVDIPEGIKVEKGNTDLVEFVRNTVK